MRLDSEDIEIGDFIWDKKSGCHVEVIDIFIEEKDLIFILENGKKIVAESETEIL